MATDFPYSDFPFPEACKALRTHIKQVSSHVLELREHDAVLAPGTASDAHEMQANIMLCYRHLEDAAMRLGKAIQAHDGGVSVYDK